MHAVAAELMQCVAEQTTPGVFRGSPPGECRLGEVRWMSRELGSRSSIRSRSCCCVSPLPSAAPCRRKRLS